MANRVFVTGTDTNVGKTVLSALLCAVLDAFYWKPIQTGASQDTDRVTVVRLTGIPTRKALPEKYCFDPPVSPHLAARQAGKEIDLGRVRLPDLPLGASLVVEGAGGVLVPLNGMSLMVDLIEHLGLPTLVAARSTLGTINHTLLSLAALKQRAIPISGVVMIGPENSDNRLAIEKYGNTPVVGTIPPLQTLDRNSLLEVYRLRFDHQVFV